VLSTLLALSVPATATLADAKLEASEFAGTWKVQDTSGKTFEIKLSPTGAAEADREGEGMKGTWTEDGPSAVIVWDTGWTTKITRVGGKFTKTAYDKDAATPTNTSPAEKVK
jgi:hypothetical protein